MSWDGQPPLILNASAAEAMPKLASVTDHIKSLRLNLMPLF